MTALHWACFHNRPAHVAALLDRAGVDPAARDIGGMTPLHWAAQVT